MIAPSLGILSSASPSLAQPAKAEPSPAAVKEAQSRFKKGSDYLTIKKYAQALEEFKKSYAAVQSPNSHLYIARSLVGLGRHRDAYLEFESVIAEAEARSKEEPKYAPTRDTAVLERDEQSNKIGLITVNVTDAGPDAKLLIAGVEVPRERWGKPYPVNAGSAEIELQIPPKAPVTKTLTLTPGGKEQVALSAAPSSGGTGGSTDPVAGGASDGSSDGGGSGDAPKKTSSLRPVAFVAAGVGVAGFALFGVAGMLTNTTYSELKDLCGGERVCPPQNATLASDKVKSGQTTQTMANIGLIVGAVGVAAAVPLFIIAFKKPSEAAKTTTGIVVAPGYTSVRGTF